MLAAGDQVEGIEVPEDVNVIAEYPLAALSAPGNAEGPAAFVEFVLSDEGRASWSRTVSCLDDETPAAVKVRPGARPPLGLLPWPRWRSPSW